MGSREQRGGKPGVVVFGLQICSDLCSLELAHPLNQSFCIS